MGPVLAIWVSLGWAQDSVGTVPRPLAGHPVFEARGGVDTQFAGHPTLCVEGLPTAWLSLEACGNGSGFVHQDDVADMLHLSARLAPVRWTEGRWGVDLLAGAGLAEIQTGRDAPGFRLTRPVEPDPVEAAGPELSAAVKARRWLDPGARTFASTELAAGVAMIAGAPDVLGHGGTSVPFASWTVGLGF